MDRAVNPIAEKSNRGLQTKATSSFMGKFNLSFWKIDKKKSQVARTSCEELKVKK